MTSNSCVENVRNAIEMYREEVDIVLARLKPA